MIDLIRKPQTGAVPIWMAQPDKCEHLPETAQSWLKVTGAKLDAGELTLIPGEDAKLIGIVCGLGADADPMAVGALGAGLPAGRYEVCFKGKDKQLMAVAILLGGYQFSRYKTANSHDITIAIDADVEDAVRIARHLYLARDMINTPTNDMGPDVMEQIIRDLAQTHDADVNVITGDALLEQNFPLIHAVGRASAIPPRLIELDWGPKDARKLTLVGKGVAFDTGGLDLKPASAMALMKKDMGGAAAVTGLAGMIMSAKRNCNLKLLIPAVENAVSGNAFRPSDVLASRKGISVEIGNTDAEGRLILADALTYGDESAPELMIDMATLTGAARVALGSDLPPLFTNDDKLATSLTRAAKAVHDPLWPMPLYAPYAKGLSSKVADTNNISPGGFAGAITAALFLQKFVQNSRSWAHLDIYGWNPKAKPHSPFGGEAQAIRALDEMISTWT